MKPTVGCYIRTLLHLKPSQIAWRVRYLLERRFFPRAFIPPAPLDAPPLHAPALERMRAFLNAIQAVHPMPPETVEDLLQNKMTFLGQTRAMEHGMDWSPDKAPPLWLYQLQGFTYARGLAAVHQASPNPVILQQLAFWLEDWIARHPVGVRPGWDAYVLSSRLLIWPCLFAVLPTASEKMRIAYLRQAAYLLRHLEWDVQANHLLKNAFALTTAGGVLADSPEGQSLLSAGLALLDQCINEQIRPDGAHYEQSLMYHGHVLEDALTTYCALEHPPAWLTSAIERMTGFLVNTLHPDGDIPLFSDAAFDASVHGVPLVQLAAAVAHFPQPEASKTSEAHASSGFYCFRSSRCHGFMIAKAGSPQPGYQLGHAHADPLTFELSFEGKRLLVDTGVCTYDAGQWRAYCRSVCAHNTVQLDDREPLEAWSAFRAGRRYRVNRVAWDASENSALLRAVHDGYHPNTHERVIHLTPEGFWLVVDIIRGHKAAQATSFLHCHPDASLTSLADGEWEVRSGGAAVTIVPFGVDRISRKRGQHQPMQGWHCPEFGRALPADTLVMKAKPACMTVLGYAIFPNSATRPSRAVLNGMIEAVVSPSCAYSS